MRAGRTLRRIVIARLTAEVAGVGGRVYDRSAEGEPTPYITLGPSDWRDDSAACVRGRVQTLQVDVWDTGTNKGVVEDIVDDVAAALEGWADTALLAMSPLRVTLARIMDDPAGGVHGVVQVEAAVEG